MVLLCGLQSEINNSVLISWCRTAQYSLNGQEFKSAEITLPLTYRVKYTCSTTNLKNLTDLSTCNNVNLSKVNLGIVNMTNNTHTNGVQCIIIGY